MVVGAEATLMEGSEQGSEQGQERWRKLTGKTADEVGATEVLLSQQDGVKQASPHSYGPGGSRQASTHLLVHSPHIQQRVAHSLELVTGHD